MNSGHHWQCIAKEHLFEGNYGPAKRYENEQSEMPNGTLEHAGFSQLVLVLDL